MSINTQLEVNEPLSSNSYSQVIDQNGNQSTVSLSQSGIEMGGTVTVTSGLLSVSGVGGPGATSTLALATYPLSAGPSDVNVVATDLGNSQANLAFNLNVRGGSSGTSNLMTVFQLDAVGTLHAPQLPGLPPSGHYAPLIIDSSGKISVGTIVVNG